MSFISLLLALLLEQARPLGKGNPIHGVIRIWVRWASRSFDAGKSHHAGLAWSFAVLGPSLASLGIYWVLLSFVGWPLAVLWSVLVLYTTLGFRQFSFHFTEIRDALADGEEDRARLLLAQWQQIDASELPRREILRHVIEHSVLAAHRHVFGVLAWFSVLAALGLGPSGAVVYRLGEFVARYWQHKSTKHHQPASQALQNAALQAWFVIDWLPARITAISFAVVGSFEEAIDAWRSYAISPGATNDGVVLAATSGAVNVRLGRVETQVFDTEDGDPESSARVVERSLNPEKGQVPELGHLAVIVGLVWRSVVMWMVLLALLTLARLLG
ncbi:CobD/CbiB family protein [Rhodoferax sp. PAMC 29310]|uniref:CobD/CbiB family protein n=1 Tax=Rhodoferax sp. PAMC 29310 TaxID=2822760 RepID=UPI001B32A95A|nr:CobD/CbiB family protein [Rhodoferax sp. PAMC 29310]